MKIMIQDAQDLLAATKKDIITIAYRFEKSPQYSINALDYIKIAMTLYKIIKIESRFTKNSTVEEYFGKSPNHDFKSILKRYEIWCKENNIELDKKKSIMMEINYLCF